KPQALSRRDVVSTGRRRRTSLLRFSLLGEYMKKIACFSVVSIFVGLMLACGGLSNEEACNKIKSVCSGSSTAGGDGGVTVNVTAQCDPASFDKISNGDDVKDCIDKASTCADVTKCSLQGKP